MTNKHRLVIVEEHALLRAGLWSLIANETDLEVVGESDNSRDTLQIVGSLQPDLVLMDICMSGISGIDLISTAKRRFPTIKILVLTLHKTDEYIQKSFIAGADGYILKGATQHELLLAIRTVLAGKAYLSPDISGTVLSTYLGAGRGVQIISSWDRLTRRERQVLKLIAEGHTNKQIAEYLFLSVKTVEKHRSNLMSKLDIHNVSKLTGFAIENGLLPGYANHNPALMHG